MISMKHAAVLAGLGTLGKNTLLLNEEYGNLLTLGAVLTDLDLESDPPAKSIQADGCSLCIQNCPSQALNGYCADQAKCRPNTYGTNTRGFNVVNCNKCRTVCPMQFGKGKQLKTGLWFNLSLRFMTCFIEFIRLLIYRYVEHLQGDRYAKI